jgi:hypothetical protein
MKKRYWIPLLVLLLLFIALHFALEPIALRQVNKALAKMEGYEGSIEDINIALFKGEYSIDSMLIQASERENEEDFFFAASTIAIGIEWKSLFRGRLVTDIIVDRPILNFISDGEKVDDAENVDFGEVLDELLPFNINTIDIHDGEVHYLDPTSEPKVDVYIKNLELRGTNLGNINEGDQPLPGHISISGTSIGEGRLEGNVDLNIMKEMPDFDLSMEMEQMNLTAINAFTDAYANFTFEEGELYLSSEIAMKDGAFKGYVKPIFENIDILDIQNEDTSIWRKAWEGLVGLTFKVFRNQPKRRFATNIPFEGDTNNTDAKIGPTIFNILKNAFIEAFDKDLDNSIHYGDLEPSEQ